MHIAWRDYLISVECGTIRSHVLGGPQIHDPLAYTFEMSSNTDYRYEVIIVLHIFHIFVLCFFCFVAKTRNVTWFATIELWPYWLCRLTHISLWDFGQGPYVSPIWCPHMLLISKVHWILDFDIYSITQKYKKSEAFMFRLELSLKTWVGVVLDLRLEGSVELLVNGWVRIWVS